MAVTAESGKNVEVNTTAELHFKINVNLDIWSHDVFVLEVSDKWVIPDNPVCKSVEVSENTNYFLAADGADALPCSADKDNNKIYVYGIENEIDIDVLGGEKGSLYFELSIGSFTAPDADFYTSAYYW
mmetsp:Transcript_22869/g.3760  ORF Transcript_22869/g.3760 Transcript_22869/m.3760 type:complete len:128 (+) Transcript_22869:455-838(+)|eukprot:CAMPEP_0168314878 /NCGR_PEP_ID=MMETSP0210-20121227/9641_1 /TAXON_ID=40633 /ORGANISM="Condylostoma magnum, Strain COL2" /LENGTH=127 /DNA_ID=CAMNT_0008285395 /DNA_START=455 /DNA_END=838 /DNA_ORIENTATION=+